MLTFPPEAGTEHTWRGTSLYHTRVNVRNENGVRGHVFLVFMRANQDLWSYFTLFASVSRADVEPGRLEAMHICPHS